jgi:SAM-dependent methyltransferase
MDFVSKHIAQHGLNRGCVLELGSLDVNGSTRPLFTNADRYIGVDMRPGPGVDLVKMAADTGLPPSSVDTVVCTEMLEHDPTPWLTMKETYRVLRAGGVALFTARGIQENNCGDCPCGRPHAFGMHGEPNDYWRFTSQTFPLLFDQVGLTLIEVIEDDPAPGWFAAARK